MPGFMPGFMVDHRGGFMPSFMLDCPPLGECGSNDDMIAFLGIKKLKQSGLSPEHEQRHCNMHVSDLASEKS